MEKARKAQHFEMNDDNVLSVEFQCTFGIYPFMDGKLEDFEPVFTKLTEVCPLSCSLMIQALNSVSVQSPPTLRLRRLRSALFPRRLRP